MTTTKPAEPELVKKINQLEAFLDPRRRKTTWVDVAVLWSVYLVGVSIPPALSTVNYVRFQWYQVTQSKAAEFLGLTPGDAESGPVSTTLSRNTTELTVGATVGGFKVTSGVGPRLSPGGVGSTNHEGVDVATPIGTKVRAPVATRVDCLSSAKGGVGARFDGLRGQVTLWHLSHCAPGRHKAGDVIALTGNTGAATTGPHLHVEVKAGGKIVPPQVRDVAPLLTRGDGGDFDAERYIAAIAQKESGKNYSRVNGDSGALGKYQFMPKTMASTAKACLGKAPTPAEFLADPTLQDDVMRCYVEAKLPTIKAKASDPVTQCRMMAATHYSGTPELWNNARPQSYNGRAYPSIADYTAAVCEGF